MEGLEKLGLGGAGGESSVVVLKPRILQDLFDNVTAIAAALHCSEVGEQVIEEGRGRLRRVVQGVLG